MFEGSEVNDESSLHCPAVALLNRKVKSEVTLL